MKFSRLSVIGLTNEKFMCLERIVLAYKKLIFRGTISLKLTLFWNTVERRFKRRRYRRKVGLRELGLTDNFYHVAKVNIGEKLHLGEKMWLLVFLLN